MPHKGPRALGRSVDRFFLLTPHTTPHHTTPHHRETLARLGWTVEEFEDGSKHTHDFSQQAAGAFRCVCCRGRGVPGVLKCWRVCYYACGLTHNFICLSWLTY